MTKFEKKCNCNINQQDIMSWTRRGNTIKNTSWSYWTSALYLALGKTLRKQVIL